MLKQFIGDTREQARANATNWQRKHPTYFMRSAKYQPTDIDGHMVERYVIEYDNPAPVKLDKNLV